MRRKATFILSILCLLFYFHSSVLALNIDSSINCRTATLPTIHNELVGTFVFEKYSDDLLLLTATVEKKQFIHALKKEGNCELKDMMQICGNQYLVENFAVKINEQQVSLKEESISIEKNLIILTYTISVQKETIKQIKVTSDYMFRYNDHSLLKVVFDLTGRSRIFSIKNKKRAITAKF